LFWRFYKKIRFAIFYAGAFITFFKNGGPL
jgi:hypothetical protein